MRTRISLLTGIFVFSATIQTAARPAQEEPEPPASDESAAAAPDVEADKGDVATEEPEPAETPEPSPASPSELSSDPEDEVAEEDDLPGVADGGDVPESGDPEGIAEEVESVEPGDEMDAVDAMDDPPKEVAADAKRVVVDTPANDDADTAGYRGGLFFLRDREDRFRIYPQAWLATDFAWSPGNPALPVPQGGAALYPRFFVSRARFGFSGEIMGRFAFTMSLELGGGRVGASNGAGDGASRFAPVSAVDDTVRPAEITASYRFRRWLNFTAGQQNVPFSMANRTRDAQTPMINRNVAIRGLAVPHSKDVGLTIWGDLLAHRMLRYEVGVFSGDGAERPVADERPAFIGRVTARPLVSLGSSTLFRQAHVGVSARYGERSQDAIDDSVPNMATAHGFVLWQPSYVDSLERLTRVIPSGVQKAVGGEMRVPIDLPYGSGLDVRGEAYYVHHRTRESVSGYEMTNTERFGQLKGVGWYAQLSWWALGDPFVGGEPGTYRPYQLTSSTKDAGARRGLEILVLAAGINASYDGASRSGSTPDDNTPSGDLTVYQLGGGVQYWYSTHFRAGLNFSTYLVPGAGEPAKNLATVPVREFYDEQGRRGIGEAVHELSGRLAVSF